MAIYVEIRKESESDSDCIYRYVAADGTLGRVKVSKTDGETKPVEIAAGDQDQRRYLLVARKLLLHFREGNFPDETCWAS